MKTIEEYSQAYAADKMCKALNLTSDCINRTDALIQKFCGKDLEEAFEDGAAHIMSLPISERITDEEREKIKKLYIDVNDKLQTCLNSMWHNQISELDNECRKGLNMGMAIALKHIFGKEMFVEKGGEDE